MTASHTPAAPRRNGTVVRPVLLQLRKASAQSPDTMARDNAAALSTWLGPELRSVCAAAAGWDTANAERFIEQLAAERRAALLASGDAGDRALEQPILSARSPRPLVIVSWLSGVAALLCMVTLMVLAQFEIGKASGAGRPLVIVLPLALLLLAGASALCGSLARRGRDRALLEQAARQGRGIAHGIPATPPLQHEPALGAIIATIGPILLLTGGAFTALSGGLMTLIVVVSGSSDGPSIGQTLPLTGVGLVLLFIGGVGTALRMHWRVRSIARGRAALTPSQARELGFLRWP